MRIHDSRTFVYVNNPYCVILTLSSFVSEKRTNVYAAVGVGFVCVIIGLPLWWKTTEVYRVSLPYSDIEELAKVKVDNNIFDEKKVTLK